MIWRLDLVEAGDYPVTHFDFPGDTRGYIELYDQYGEANGTATLA